MILQIAVAWKPLMKRIRLWKSIRSMARLYDAGMGMIIFVPIALFSWFPFVSTFQTRLMFNQAFSRGLEISLILAGNNPNNGIWGYRTYKARGTRTNYIRSFLLHHPTPPFFVSFFFFFWFLDERVLGELISCLGPVRWLEHVNVCCAFCCIAACVLCLWIYDKTFERRKKTNEFSTFFVFSMYLYIYIYICQHVLWNWHSNSTISKHFHNFEMGHLINCGLFLFLC